MRGECSHTDQILVRAPDHVEGCEECLASGDRWVHLRACLTCGKIGCCDSSPNRHARKHAEAEGHPVIASAQPGEHWGWCFVDEVMLRLEG